MKCVASKERNSTFSNDTKQERLTSYLSFVVIISKKSRGPGGQDILGSTNTVN